MDHINAILTENDVSLDFVFEYYCTLKTNYRAIFDDGTKKESFELCNTFTTGNVVLSHFEIGASP